MSSTVTSEGASLSLKPYLMMDSKSSTVSFSRYLTLFDHPVDMFFGKSVSFSVTSLAYFRRTSVSPLKPISSSLPSNGIKLPGELPLG